MSLAVPLLVALLSPAHAKRPKPVEAASPVVAPPPVEVAAPVATPAPVDAVPRFEKVPIPGCGCSAYLPKGAVVDPVTSSEDGSQVWTSEHQVGEHFFAIVAVKLSFTAEDADAAEGVLLAYLDFLKAQFEITESVGVGKGHTLDGSSARGVIDFWKSKDGEQWSVKGWSTPDRLGVMMVHGPGEAPSFNAVQLFLNGFRFE